MYLGIDGTGCPMRKGEVEGRKGKQPDGSAKTREVKLAVVFSADSRDKEGKPKRDQGSASYNAAIESAATADLDETLSDFAQRVEREARRRGLERNCRAPSTNSENIEVVDLSERGQQDGSSCHSQTIFTGYCRMSGSGVTIG